MNINQKTLSFLIDSLVTSDLRCWFSQEKIMDESLSDKERLDAAIRAQEQNAIRSELMKAIDEMVGQGKFSSGGKKSYYTYFDKKEDK
jgi:hypothetical protein